MSARAHEGHCSRMTTDVNGDARTAEGSAQAVALPRKQRERSVLFRAIAQTLASKSQYSERELNGSLDAWAGSIGVDASLDRVSLRRYLVESGCLLRDDAGTRHTVRLEGNEGVSFDKDVETLDVVDFVRSLKARANDRKLQRLNR